MACQYRSPQPNGWVKFDAATFAALLTLLTSRVFLSSSMKVTCHITLPWLSSREVGSTCLSVIWSATYWVPAAEVRNPPLPQLSHDISVLSREHLVLHTPARLQRLSNIPASVPAPAKYSTLRSLFFLFDPLHHEVLPTLIESAYTLALPSGIDADLPNISYVPKSD
ncbi:hypothetical protein EDB92DRAFT_1504104 [Lactarius akahatsu]|uniref:Uncharacterized protein n=1 Tax=Lactarius akahatsu TaxID=416441 RepID=A0AAD4LCB4_9AGAM|nr:hypothetical protein EDB92DRAFT_1504104 [Lactarius akahatsu]